jgi:drug/metabolite transporter (DMT)-like permease
MTLNIWALTIVKALGLGYPVTQIVFLRACVGLLVMVPWAIRSRHAFRNIKRWDLHALRVGFSALALTASFFAIARLPFAMVTTISFTRPVLTMVMAVMFLNEVVSRRRWVAAGIAFVGVLIAIQPGAVSFTWGLPAMGLAVFFGTSAIILTRRLSQTPTVVMMVFYTAGLAALTAPFAVYSWTEITPAHLIPLLAVGAFSQCAQFCFLQAHQRAEAGFLAILGYFSLVLTTSIGYLFFDEIPSVALFIGASLIVGAALWTALTSRVGSRIG